MWVSSSFVAAVLVLVGAFSDRQEAPDSAVETEMSDVVAVIDGTNDNLAASTKFPRATSAGFLLLGLRMVPILGALLCVWVSAAGADNVPERANRRISRRRKAQGFPPGPGMWRLAQPGRVGTTFSHTTPHISQPPSI